MRRIAAALALVAGCSTSEYTGRRQLMLVSEAQEAQLGVQGYQEALAAARVSRDPRETGPVERVGRRIADAANRPDFQWEYHVIVDDKTVNAWCMPGGKIAFYTGIFPILQDEAGMAFVMGHEVSHALLRHGGERLSQNLAAGALGTLLEAGLGGGDAKKRGLVQACFGAVAGVGVLLPFSRKHESEADALGLELMAKAGYDPRASIETWKRMQQRAGDGGPEFLSTHPSHETRIHDLEERMPGALALYAKSSPAPVAALPPTSNRPGTSKAAGAAFVLGSSGGAAGLRGGEARRQGTSLAFAFAPERDVYVHAVDVQGPAGAARVEAQAGIPAKARRALTLTGGREFPPGHYVLSFQGTSSGAGFTERLEYDVK